jgi:hypothetical protein
MNNKLISTLALGLIALLAFPVMAQELSRLKRLEGWIVDEPSGAKHANAESKEAVIEAHANGALLVFVSKQGDIYEIVGQEAALENVGRNWIVLGVVDPEGKLTIGSFIDPSKRKKPEPKPAEE